MLSRRDVFATPLVGRLFASAPADGDHTPADDDQMSDRTGQQLVSAVKDVVAAIAAQRSFGDIAPVRQKQIEFLRGAGKFPDFIEVGTDVWLAVHDWHVRHLQPITMGRDGTGRYTIMFMNTTVIMRPEATPSFVGPAYDNR
jgi:hypothetical protein